MHRSEMTAVGTTFMQKALCIAGLVVAALLLIIFGLDLATSLLTGSGFPFGGLSYGADIGYVVVSAVLGFLSWTTLREQT
jgi:uncharacterized membrane protein